MTSIRFTPVSLIFIIVLKKPQLLLFSIHNLVILQTYSNNILFTISVKHKDDPIFI